ncbi:MAG: class I SAM-dependent methyltransferase, partial [Dehalococcoidia bacterium]|nr:class I SAM-dependent methyltransferase [Dehalococcoidia bacterium]
METTDQDPASARLYASRVAARMGTRSGHAVAGGDRWERRAAVFRMDPRRALDPNLAALAALVRPEDALLDVGGGAGRVSLPLALRCREVVNLDPSPAMRQQFEEAAREAGVANARVVAGSWPEAAGGVSADVVIAVNVTYFVEEIVPFVLALDAAARRLVAIAVWSVPPPDHPAVLHELVWGERPVPAPSYRELLPVLWDLGILPDVTVLPEPFRLLRRLPTDRAAAVEYALQAIDAEPEEAVVAAIE